MIFVGSKVPRTCTFCLRFPSITFFSFVSDEESNTDEESVPNIGSLTLEDETRVAGPIGQFQFFIYSYYYCSSA